MTIDYESAGSDEDDCGIVVPKGTKYFKVFFWNAFLNSAKLKCISFLKKKYILYKESIIVN